MKLLNFVIIKLTLCLVIGVIIGYYLSPSINVLFISCVILITLIFVIHKTIHRKKHLHNLFRILVILTMISLGCLNFKTHEQYNHHSHYLNSISVKNDSTYLLSFRVREVLKPGNYYNKYVIDILKFQNKKASGKILLNIAKDSVVPSLKVDEVYVTQTQFKELIPPLNPYQFDYKSYLKKKHIYHQLFLSNRELLPISSHKHTLFGYASTLRESINSKLSKFNFKKDELAIINALLLGQRQDISPEIYNSYTQAGAIHILAVSGLHVGIILFLLNFVFKPIEHLKYGKQLKTLILVLILWSFAIIAGLSASVVRAVTMFTIVAFAINLKRPTNVYNTVTISAFILLLLKPTFLFDVGFQLSYLAVFAIVAIQPLLFKLWKPKLKIFTFFWNVFTVTIAAQFGIIPISLYYFHQFPGLFFISNLVIIPFLGFILGFGLLIIGSALLNILPHVLANLFGSIISMMNNFVSWVANQEAFLFKNISFNLSQVLISYILIFLSFIWIKRRNYKTTLTLLIAIVISQCTFLINKTKNKNSFVVFHKSRHSVLGELRGDHLTLFLNAKDTFLLNEKMITNYKIGVNPKTITIDTIKPVFLIQKKKLLVIDSMGVYNIKSFKPDIVLLQNSPKINLKRLINLLQPKLIISDGSNYKSYQERWKSTCIEKEIPFHQTSKKGAFIYNY